MAPQTVYKYKTDPVIEAPNFLFTKLKRRKAIILGDNAANSTHAIKLKSQFVLETNKLSKIKKGIKLIAPNIEINVNLWKSGNFDFQQNIYIV